MEQEQTQQKKNKKPILFGLLMLLIGGIVGGTFAYKTIIAKNTGDVEAAVRVKLVESWKDANNQTLALKDGNNNAAAIINFASDLNTKWTKDGDWYYYKTKLTKNQSTSSLIQSVTFNPAVTIATDNNCVEDATAHTRTCTTTTSGYAGGTYKLDITVETVQYDQYQTAWSTSVAIN